MLFQGAEELAELASFVHRTAIVQEPPLCHLPTDARAANLVESVLAVLLFRDRCSSRTFRAKDEYMEEVGNLLQRGPEAVAHAVTVVRWNVGRNPSENQYPVMLSRLRAVRRAVADSTDNPFLNSIGSHIKSGIEEYHACSRAAPSGGSRDPRDQPGYLNFQQAARQCAVPTSIFRRLVRKGVVPSRAVNPGRKVIRRFIEPQIVAQLNEFRLGLFDLQELSKRLDITPALCSFLVKAGAVRGVWGERTRYRDMYRRADVERLLQRLTEVAQPVAAENDGVALVALNQLGHQRPSAAVFAPVAEALLMALRGQTPVYLIDPNARGLSRWGISAHVRRQARMASVLSQPQTVNQGEQNARATGEVVL